MKESEQLDNLVKRKLAQRRYEAPPGAWDAAERLIVADQRRNKRRWGWFMFLGLLLLGGIGLGFGWPWLATGLGLTPDPMAQATVASSFDAMAHAPIIEVEACPQGSKTQANRSREAQLALANTQSHPGQPSSQVANRLAASAAIPQRVQPTSPVIPPQNPQRKADPLPEGSEYTGLGAVYALARRDQALPAPLLHPLATPVDIPIPAGDQRRWSWFVEAGLNLSQSWQNTRLAPMLPIWGPTVGTGLSYSLGPAAQISLGLRYQNRGGLNSDSTYLREELTFDRRDTSATVDPLRLHLLGVPLRMDWRLANRHYLQLGTQLNVLLNTSGRLTEQTDGEVLTDETRWGYRQGFVPWDAQLLLGYRYYLGKGVRVGVSGSYGLRDLTEASFFQNDRRNRAWNLRLMIESTLGRF